MADNPFGILLQGSADVLRRSYELWQRQPLDWDLSDGESLPVARKQRTVAKPVTVKGPGTFFHKSIRTVTIEPTDMEGWWFERTDMQDVLPFAVSPRNVWTTGDVVSNIVLRAGPPHNYVRMVEHIIALKAGMAIDNVLIKIDAGDPPLFNRGSMDLVEAFDEAGVKEVDAPAKYFTVRETVSVVSPSGSFLIIQPCDPARPELTLDCAVDFTTAIGQQRIRVPINARNFRMGAEARTNTSYAKMLYVSTIGQIFADTRNLGYSRENILIASRKGYVNEPRLIHEGKSLEAAWHRATLDLLAAIALIEEGQFAGHVISYKAGHGLDVEMIRQLYKKKLLKRVE
ncbi:MAG TPA: UDP-3-O-acyl-N-acetylglucosamine deacetylase [Kiritimatiellia bacterium]|nr:UDP-3-O-acyl-N-acetylglucosamine deacetylase [Kiritimatiellia bacterium]